MVRLMLKYSDDGKDATKIYSKEQIDYIKSIGFEVDFTDMSDDDWCNLEETVGDKLVLECLDENYCPNEEGIMCKSILDLLPIED
jgi:hypothetical protein